MGWKIRKLSTFESLHRLYANYRVDDVISSIFCIRFEHKVNKNIAFLFWEYKTLFESSLRMCKITITVTYCNIKGTCLQVRGLIL